MAKSWYLYAAIIVAYTGELTSRPTVWLRSGHCLPFVPVRKKGKLPYTTVSEKYSLEYGFDEVEIHIDAFEYETGKKAAKVLLIDDLIATGGTAKAAANLIDKVGANCVEVCFIMELAFLNGRESFTTPVYSVLVEN